MEFSMRIADLLIAGMEVIGLLSIHFWGSVAIGFHRTTSRLRRAPRERAFVMVMRGAAKTTGIIAALSSICAIYWAGRQLLEGDEIIWTAIAIAAIAQAYMLWLFCAVIKWAMRRAKMN